MYETTTLALEDGLLRSLKEKAAREGRTLQQTANDLLRQGLNPLASLRPVLLFCAMPLISTLASFLH
jgi:plasmid stability protein